MENFFFRLIDCLIPGARIPHSQLIV